jgi:ABC-type Mn2+/Zn2+ transport system ATPase subunit
MLNLIINNCNSIDSGLISIKKNALNVKYGINGTGKSTLAKAICFQVVDPEKLKSLTPFKYLGNNDLNFKPQVDGLDEIKSIMIFDEDYVNNFTFKKDEIVQNSFEIFIKDETYNDKSREIERFIDGMKNEFSNNEGLADLISVLTELSSYFGKSATKNGISKSSQFYKGLSSGNKLDNIPDEVSQYTNFLLSESNTQWISWQSKGNEFLDIDECCPFCATEITAKKDDVRKIASTYEPKNFEFLVNILEIVGKLGEYLDCGTKNQILEITQNKTGISKEEELVLKQVKEQIDVLLIKLNDLRLLNDFAFSGDDKVIEKINSLYIKLDRLSHLNSNKIAEIIIGINSSLEYMSREVMIFQKRVGEQRAHINKLINKNKSEINEFLIKAGYRYQVFFDANNSGFPMKLKHIDCEGSISEGRQHLSYGEKNAFSMLLFMYECLSKKPSLIVLDDPISSFDKNKKYAIMRKLFVEKNSLKNKTVLMLTHDFDPIVDFFKIIPLQSNNKACFIYNKLGIIKEEVISKGDVLTFIQVCDLNMKRNIHPVIKIIYLRRKLDAINDRTEAYNLISNITHKRAIPIYKAYGQIDRDMTDDEIKIGEEFIRLYVDEFDYLSCVNTTANKHEMIDMYNNSENDYEKLQIFRILTDDVDLKNNYLQKYINEVFHIENDNISQLDPNKYQLVPDFIVHACDLFVENLS